MSLWADDHWKAPDIGLRHYEYDRARERGTTTFGAENVAVFFFFSPTYEASSPSRQQLSRPAGQLLGVAPFDSPATRACALDQVHTAGAYETQARRSVLGR